MTKYGSESLSNWIFYPQHLVVESNWAKVFRNPPACRFQVLPKYASSLQLYRSSASKFVKCLFPPSCPSLDLPLDSRSFSQTTSIIPAMSPRISDISNRLHPVPGQEPGGKHAKYQALSCNGPSSSTGQFFSSPLNEVLFRTLTCQETFSTIVLRRP